MSQRPQLSTVLIALPAAAFAAVVFGAVCLALAAGGSGTCGSEATGTVKGVPAKLIPIYQEASSKYRLGVRGPSMLASINFNETSFGTNMNNTTGSGAMGWMMFMPETWAAYGVDGNGDGTKDPYNPWDAIFAAARYLRASGAPGNWHDAVFAYNHAEWYVERVFEDAERFDGGGLAEVTSATSCGPSVGGAAILRESETLYQPRAFKPLPAKLWIGGGSPQEVDARIWPDAVWLLETYGMVVTAARETGHQTHGDGTALDIVPASGRGWDAVERAATDLGWRESCGASGTAPVCPLIPAIQFVGYNGYPSHGDPAHAGENAHLHISWKSSEYGCPGLCEPRQWVVVFPLAGP